MYNDDRSQSNSIEVKTPSGIKILCVKEILFIEAARKCSIIQLVEPSSTIITFHILKWYDNVLIEPYYFRCHNSYMINCLHVDCFTHNWIKMKNNIKIPMSRGKILSFKENLKILIGEFS
jgi:DNA-binding LytR/AlgR family response regulator